MSSVFNIGHFYSENKNPSNCELLGFLHLTLTDIRRKIFVNFDDFIKFLSFCLKVFDDMKAYRFWALWFLGLLLCLAVLISAVKWW